MSEPPDPNDSPTLPAGGPSSPGGLLGLLLWPLQRAIEVALKLAAGIIAGILGAMVPGAEPPEGPDGPT